MRTARKLRNRRRVQKWADKQYKKAHLGTRWKANPFGGSSHAKGIVVEKLGIEAKQVLYIHLCVGFSYVFMLYIYVYVLYIYIYMFSIFCLYRVFYCIYIYIYIY